MTAPTSFKCAMVSVYWFRQLWHWGQYATTCVIITLPTDITRRSINSLYSSFSNNWGVLCQKQISRAGRSNFTPQILWNVNTCSCLDTYVYHNTPQLSCAVPLTRKCNHMYRAFHAVTWLLWTIKHRWLGQDNAQIWFYIVMHVYLFMSRNLSIITPSGIMPCAMAWPYVAHADRDVSRLNGISLDTKRLFSLRACKDQLVTTDG